MTVRREGGSLYLEGRCGAEEAETLLVALQEAPELTIDASRLTRMHLAVAQVLLVCQPRVIAAPRDRVLSGAIFSP